MISVIVVGKNSGISLDRLKQSFHCKKNIWQFDENRVAMNNLPPDILLMRCKRPAQLFLTRSILVVDTDPPESPCSLTGEYIAIVRSDHTAGLDFLSNQKIPAITCGRSPQDTITLSSFTEDSAVVCVQRPICTLGGKTIEPSEFPLCDYTNTDPFSIMANTAILLLCDCPPSGVQ